MTEKEEKAALKKIMSGLGKKGGTETLKRHGKKHFIEMNKKSQLKRYGKIKEHDLRRPTNGE